MDAPATQLKSGQILDNRYEIRRRLGYGGMGEVYEARRLALGDLVAIKCLLPDRDNPQNRARFLTEARAAAHIRHPNVVCVFDFGDPPGKTPYIVMEYLDGRTLGDELSALGTLDPARALGLFATICAAVGAGHRRGIVHRDLKPSNIMLAAADDGSEIVKVLDFGLARMLSGPDPGLTEPGSIVGTVSFMAPEQAGHQPIVPATDVWALGVILYAMVTGKTPFEGNSAAEVLMRIGRGVYRPPDELCPNLPQSITDAIAAALRRDPEERPQSPEQLARMAVASDRELTPAQAEPKRDSAQPARLPERPFQVGDSSVSATDPTTDLAATGSISALAGRPSGQYQAEFTPGQAAGRPVIRSVSDSAPAVSAGPRFGCFVGREKLLSGLREEYAAATNGQGRIVVVAGEAGVGKTRLVAEFARRASDQGAVVLGGRFFDYEGSRPPALDTFLGLLADDRSPRPGELGVLCQQAQLHGSAQRGESDRWRVFAAISDALAARSGSRPLVLWFDDLQWASRLDLDFIEYLHRVLGLRGTLIVATARSGGDASELGAWLEIQTRRRNHTILQVAGFTLDEARSWFHAVFENLRIRAQDLRRLVHATSGNPHYLTEVVRHLWTGGAIEQSSDGTTVRCARLDDVALPESVANVVRVRLARLDDDHRTLLAIAAVIGEEFRFETLEEATGVAEDALEAVLETAVGERFLSDRGVSAGNDYRFTSAVMRNVLYEDMSGRRRKRAHRAVVGALHRLYDHRGDRFAPVLAYHHHAVGDWPDAFHWGLRAIATALDQYDYDVAEIAVTRAQQARAQMTSTGVPPERQGALRLDQLAGALYLHIGRLEEAHTLLTRVTTDADAAQTPETWLSALADLARCHSERGDFESAFGAACRAADEARAAGGRSWELVSRMIAGRALSQQGRMAEATGHIDRVLADLADSDPAWLRSRAHRERAWAYCKAGAWSEAERHAELALQLARIDGDLPSQRAAMNTRGAILSERGEHARAVPIEREVLEIARRLGMRRVEAIALANLGETHYKLDELDRALSYLREALDILIEIGDRAGEGDCRVNLGRALLALGQHDRAIAMLEQGRELCEATGRFEYAGIALVHLGNACLHNGELARAGNAFGRAGQLFETIDSHLLWSAKLGGVQVALLAGDRDRAVELLQKAIAHIEALRAHLPRGGDSTGFERLVSPAYQLRDIMGLGPSTLGPGR